MTRDFGLWWEAELTGGYAEFLDKNLKSQFPSVPLESLIAGSHDTDFTLEGHSSAGRIVYRGVYLSFRNTSPTFTKSHRQSSAIVTATKASAAHTKRSTQGDISSLKDAQTRISRARPSPIGEDMVNARTAWKLRSIVTGH